jgi:lipid II:glycine glycyltransferase (peptidoglycan interpeptide bridge formation enzyme)
VQTSLWAEVKRPSGWRVARILAEEGDALVGGCQILLRRVARLGSIGYVTRGPLAVESRAEVAQEVLSSLDAFGGSRRLLYAKVQPPERRDDLASTLIDDNWLESDLTVAPRATVRVDVRKTDEELSRALRSSVRRNVKIAS